MGSWKNKISWVLKFRQHCVCLFYMKISYARKSPADIFFGIINKLPHLLLEWSIVVKKLDVGQIFCCFLIVFKILLACFLRLPGLDSLPTFICLFSLLGLYCPCLAYFRFSLFLCVRLCPGKESWLSWEFVGARLLQPLWPYLLQSPGIHLTRWYWTRKTSFGAILKLACFDL